MNVLSLCTGYGGLDLAVEAVIPGARTRWVSDIDRDACAVQAVRFADAEQLGDLKLVDWSAFAGRVDILSAGYPCQPFSTAGRRKGTDDPRHLWPWVADAIRLVGPRLVVLENVAGHLALGFDAVLADLAEMGMSARWGIVRASDAGAPHRRERLFVVGHPSGVGLQGSFNHPRHLGCEGSVPEASRGTVAARTAADADSQPGNQGVSGSVPVPGPSAIERSRRCSGVGAPTDWGRFGPAIRQWECVLGRGAPAPLVDRTRQLNARFVEWMMGLETGWVTDIIPNRRALKVLGNGVVPQQAAMALGVLLTEATDA